MTSSNQIKRIMDRFSALKAFTRVVEAGSFTRAADSLNMPNATLSKTIQQLEAHLGVSLLQRTRGVLP
ncbi:LysR family transcriptional regulator [Klebsiella pneumoniae]|uniref:LysR family transcriptional regulator n=1 Tax=Klebsiella pneumoniae TaxID=573 RepID=A0A2X1Q530_KLEPN|nr:LysR family transcriptional regulator [Klebsiella pneumoniae]